MSIVARLAPLCGIISVGLWGVSFSAAKIVYEQLGVYELTLVRMGLSALCFVPILVYDLYKNSLPSARDFRLLVIAGIFSFVFTLMFQYIGLSYVNASLASIAVGLEGLFAMMMAYIFLKQKPAKSNYWVALISLVGLVIVVGVPEQAKITGVFFIMMANLCAGISIVANKPLFETMSVSAVTAWTIIIGFIVLLLASPFMGTPNFSTYTAKTWVALLIISFGSTAIAYLLHSICLKYLSATRAAQFIVLEPIFGVFAAITILGEPLTIAIIIGTTLIALAMVINSTVDDGNL